MPKNILMTMWFHSPRSEKVENLLFLKTYVSFLITASTVFNLNAKNVNGVLLGVVSAFYTTIPEKKHHIPKKKFNPDVARALDGRIRGRSCGQI